MPYVRFPLARAFMYIGLSALPLLLVIIGLIIARSLHLPNTPIEGVIVCGPQTAHPQWIAEVLDLTCDEPICMDQMDLRKAEQVLLQTHVIEHVSLRLCKPHLLYVHLIARIPVAELIDFPGTGIDRSGVLFPLKPIYVSYRLPQVYLGALCPFPPWGQHLESTLAHAITDLVSHSQVRYADMSQWQASSLGQRVCKIGWEGGGLLLCSPEQLFQQITYYETLPLEMFHGPLLMDLRLPGTAIIQEIYPISK